MKKNNLTKPLWLFVLSISTQVSLHAQGPIPPQPVPIPPAMAGTPLWTIQGQVRTRSEIRHGLGNPVPAASIPAFFTSQRTALNIGFRWDKLGFGLQLRDVRVWGQDASSITNADGNKFFIHQAWGEFTLGTKLDTNARFQLLDNITLKVGRQEIVYDDVRLLGNLDWLQQGRRHDAALLKITHQGHQFDVGAAFNQNSDAFGLQGTTYAPGNTGGTATSTNGTLVAIPAGFLPTNGQGAPITSNPPSTNGQNQMYKSFQYLYWSRKWNQTKFSVLAFKDDFAKYTLDTVWVNRFSTDVNKPSSFVAGRRYGQSNDVNSRYTVGGQVNTQFGNASEFGRVLLNGGGYYQFGKNRDGQELSAYHFFGNALYTKNKWGIGPGYEYLSGNDGEAAAKEGGINAKDGNGNFKITDNRFDPLYGTPHRWWGYMDYYYVGTGAPLGGLQNIYVRGQYKAKDLIITLDVHQFMTANKLWRAPYVDASGVRQAGEVISSNLGNEIDLVVNYQANKFVNIEAGACVYFSTFSTEIAKLNTPGMPAAYNGKRATGDFQQWGYVQLNITPDFLFQKPVPLTN